MPRLSHFLLCSSLVACASGPAGPDATTAEGLRVASVVAPDAAESATGTKVYHHVYAADGRRLTKGDGGQFPHHKGLFLGWNRTEAGGERYDFWHLNRGESQRLRGYLEPEALDLPSGAQVLQVDWCAPDGRAVVHELRGLAVTTLDDGSVALDVRVRLASAGADVLLAGDPQHSGHQLRLLQRFAEEGAEKVRYLRPPGAVARDNDVWTDCGWIAAIAPLPDGPVTVLRIEGARNPGEARWSTRPYGRFGATRELRVTEGAPVELDWCYVVADGERDAAWCEATAARARTGWRAARDLTR